ncbi:MAG: hypothetical protein ACOX69_04950, partial [Coriobacteriales bacterium]
HSRRYQNQSFKNHPLNLTKIYQLSRVISERRRSKPCTISNLKKNFNKTNTANRWCPIAYRGIDARKDQLESEKC